MYNEVNVTSYVTSVLRVRIKIYYINDAVRKIAVSVPEGSGLGSFSCLSAATFLVTMKFFYTAWWIFFSLPFFNKKKNLCEWWHFILVFTKKKFPHVFIVTAQKKPCLIIWPPYSIELFFVSKKKKIFPSPHKFFDSKIHRTFFIPKKILKKISPPPSFFEGRNPSNSEWNWCSLTPHV